MLTFWVLSSCGQRMACNAIRRSPNKRQNRLGDWVGTKFISAAGALLSLLVLQLNASVHNHYKAGWAPQPRPKRGPQNETSRRIGGPDLPPLDQTRHTESSRQASGGWKERVTLLNHRSREGLAEIIYLRLTFWFEELGHKCLLCHGILLKTISDKELVRTSLQESASDVEAGERKNFSKLEVITRLSIILPFWGG